ncbi:MAG: glycosyltransferase family 4 protein [Thermoguttaceae bacterium]
MPTRAPRLLILCEYSTLNGGEQSMLSTLPAIADAGFSVTVASPPDGPLTARLRQLGVAHAPLATHWPDGRHLLQDECRRRLRELLVDHRTDLLHANSLSTGRLSGPVAADLGIASLAHLRDIVGLSRRAVDDLNRHRRLLAVSQATRQFHLRQGLDPRRTFVQYNGVDLQRFRPAAGPVRLREQLSLPPSARLVVTAGQIGLRKGQDVLVDAAVRVSADFLHVHWLVVGERFSEKDESRRFEDHLREAADGPLAGRMHLLGWRDDMVGILQEADLLVHPARQEPLGRVLLEAAASGLPVVATDVGGTSEIFPSQDDGALLVPAGDSAAVAAAVVRLLTDDTLRQSMCQAVRRRAESAFDVRGAAAGLIGHYRDVLGVSGSELQNPTPDRAASGDDPSTA